LKGRRRATPYAMSIGSDSAATMGGDGICTYAVFASTPVRVAGSEKPVMRSFLRATSLLSLAVLFFLTGCGTIPQRRAIRESVSPDPIDPRMFARIAGVYTGPIRTTTKRFGTQGVRLFETRLEVYGSPESPDVFFKIQTAFTGAWNVYGENSEEFTNIPDRRYGTQGYIVATTHAPDQLRIKLRAGAFSPHVGSFLIVTFRGRDCADVRWIGRSGWHGEGSLHRMPSFPDNCRWDGSVVSHARMK